MSNLLEKKRPYRKGDRVVISSTLVREAGQTGTVTGVQWVMIPDDGGAMRRHYSGVTVKMDQGGEQAFSLDTVAPMRYPRCAKCGQENDGENVYWNDGGFYCRVCKHWASGRITPVG
jgi:hypothetical protein